MTVPSTPWRDDGLPPERAAGRDPEHPLRLVTPRVDLTSVSASVDAVVDRPVENSSRNPRENVSFGLTRKTSSAYHAPKSDRQFISVGEGSQRKLESDPARKFDKLENVACPY